jgi:hypothetical protein
MNLGPGGRSLPLPAPRRPTTACTRPPTRRLSCSGNPSGRRVMPGVSRLRVLMGSDSYSRAEVLAAGNVLPERGALCHECGAIIPVFEELVEADERRIRYLIRDGRPLMAMAELRAATGCSLPWAKLWVQHEGKPKPADGPASCPYCGEPLRTSLAKQCRFCRRDWHDPGYVVTPGAG